MQSVFTQFTLPSMCSYFCYRWPADQNNQDTHTSSNSLLHWIIYQISNEVDILFFELTKGAPEFQEFPCKRTSIIYLVETKVHRIPTSNYFSTRHELFTMYATKMVRTRFFVRYLFFVSLGTKVVYTNNPMVEAPVTNQCYQCR